MTTGAVRGLPPAAAADPSLEMSLVALLSGTAFSSQYKLGALVLVAAGSVAVGAGAWALGGSAGGWLGACAVGALTGLLAAIVGALASALAFHRIRVSPFSYVHLVLWRWPSRVRQPSLRSLACRLDAPRLWLSDAWSRIDEMEDVERERQRAIRHSLAFGLIHLVLISLPPAATLLGLVMRDGALGAALPLSIGAELLGGIVYWDRVVIPRAAQVYAVDVRELLRKQRLRRGKRWPLGPRWEPPAEGE